MATTPSQRCKAEDLLLHQSRAANKRLGSRSASAHRFRSLYSDRLAYWIFLIVPAQAIATKWFERFKEFPHRDRISKAVMEDPQLKVSMDPSKMPFDGKRMFWGGFETITELAAGR